MWTNGTFVNLGITAVSRGGQLLDKLSAQMGWEGAKQRRSVAALSAREDEKFRAALHGAYDEEIAEISDTAKYTTGLAESMKGFVDEAVSQYEDLGTSIGRLGRRMSEMEAELQERFDADVTQYDNIHTLTNLLFQLIGHAGLTVNGDTIA